MARVYKACYFPSKCILEATKGSDSSYMWSSLQKAKGIIEYRVASGVFEMV